MGGGALGGLSNMANPYANDSYLEQRRMEEVMRNHQRVMEASIMQHALSQGVAGQLMSGQPAKPADNPVLLLLDPS